MLPFCRIHENGDFKYGRSEQGSWRALEGADVGPHRVQDGPQDDLVGAALQDDLDVPLQQPRLCEELGLGSKRLRGLCAVGFPLEGGTLRRRDARKNI